MDSAQCGPSRLPYTFAFFNFCFILPWASLSAGKCQEGYHLPQSGHTPRLGQQNCPRGVRHYLTSMDTGQLPTAYTQTYTMCRHTQMCVTLAHVHMKRRNTHSTHTPSVLSLGWNEIPLKTGGPAIPPGRFHRLRGMVPITFGWSLFVLWDQVSSFDIWIFWFLSKQKLAYRRYWRTVWMCSPADTGLRGQREDREHRVTVTHVGHTWRGQFPSASWWSSTVPLRWMPLDLDKCFHGNKLSFMRGWCIRHEKVGWPKSSFFSAAAQQPL